MSVLKITSLIMILSFLFLGAVTSPNHAFAETGDVVKLNWKDLIPEGVEQDVMVGVYGHDLDCLDHGDPDCWEKMQRLEKTKNLIVTSYNEKTVRIPGYMVPLNFDSAQTTEFLLVPYAGACIHVPPPPPNQIIYVNSAQKVDVLDYRIPIIAIGILKTGETATKLADVGYKMNLHNIVEYSE